MSKYVLKKVVLDCDTIDPLLERADDANLEDEIGSRAAYLVRVTAYLIANPAS